MQNHPVTISSNIARKIYPSAPDELKSSLEESFGKDFFNTNIADRIKTFEDACKATNRDPADFQFEFPNTASNLTKPAIAAAKIMVIAEALNEGWVPNWKDEDEYKYWPWYDLSSGSGLAFGACDFDCSFSYVGSRLCFRTQELAEYAGKQFIDIYTDFFIIK